MAASSSPALSSGGDDALLISWLRRVCAQQTFSNPGWLEPDLERLKGCTPAWVNENTFPWSVVSLLGYYNKILFNVHAPAVSRFVYFGLQLTSSEERISVGHIHCGPQYVVELLPDDAGVVLIELSNNSEECIVGSLLEFMQLVKLWVDSFLPRDDAAYDAGLAAMKEGSSGPSGSSFICQATSFVVLPDFLRQRVPPAPKARLPPQTPPPEVKRPRTSATCYQCDKKATASEFKVCSYCGEANDCAWFCLDCANEEEGTWCNRCDACFQCCSLGHD